MVCHSDGACCVGTFPIGNSKQKTVENKQRFFTMVAINTPFFYFLVSNETNSSLRFESLNNEITELFVNYSANENVLNKRGGFWS